VKVARVGSTFAGHWIEDSALACDHPRAGRLDRYTRLAVAAAQTLVQGAHPELGIFLASEWGSFGANADHWAGIASGAPASPLVFPATVPSAAAGEVAISLGAMGPNVTCVGDAASLIPLAHAAMRAGDCAAALVGVVEAWHPRMAALGLDWRTHDGACLVWLEPGWQPVFAPAPSALLAFAQAVGA
jgi:3-oxoacyl-(acyl-carrier-protein) synthase